MKRLETFIHIVAFTVVPPLLLLSLLLKNVELRKTINIKTLETCHFHIL